MSSPSLARDQLHGRTIDVAGERVQPIVHRPELTLRGGRERGLGADRLVVIERQRAMHPAQLAWEHPGQRVERGLDAIAVPTGVVAPVDDRHRRIDRAIRGRLAARDLVDRLGIEGQPSIRVRRGDEQRQAEGENEADNAAQREHEGRPRQRHAADPSTLASAVPRGPVPVAVSSRSSPSCASSIRR